MLCRDEMSEGICPARTVTENGENRTPFEKNNDQKNNKEENENIIFSMPYGEIP